MSGYEAERMNAKWIKKRLGKEVNRVIRLFKVAMKLEIQGRCLQRDHLQVNNVALKGFSIRKSREGQ